MIMDIVAIVVATAIGMGVGALWYGPLLGEEWRQLTGVEKDSPEQASLPLLLGVTLALELLVAFSFVLLAGYLSVMSGVALGSAAALYFAIGLGINYLFEHKPMRLYLINIGHMSLVFILMGAVIGFLR